ncbi:hypothetical protein [Marinobacter sp.]|jgi:hypothetical protein|uniref:hypothetical protein n=1 Tax=Marinobacter sp. TaxID=50741 RepID=UPI002357EE3D|nr:hypothetical protein [Marinobacter sp.]|tara:strand:+ start:2868 stop:3254 length:387 start_codon:yes stop_codon:yes gene_type:complete
MAKVYLVNRPKVNKFGWTPDLSDASRYGSIEVVFEANEKPQFLPNPSIQKARRILKDFGPEDYLLWPGGGDPIAVMIVCMIAAENSPIVRILRWERNIEEGDRDRRKGWYMPVALEMRKENNDNKSTR